MKPDEKDQNKKASDKQGPEASRKGKPEHGTESEGHTSTDHEPTLRSATTDSSRVPKNPHDDLPTGGNVR